MAKNLKAPMPAVEADEATASNPLDQLLGYQLRRASVAMLADLAASLADLSLRVTEVSIILVIEENPGISQSEIGRVLAIQRANMVPLTTHLEGRRLIRRGTITGRAQALELTATGQSTAQECRKLVAAHEARFFTSLSKLQRSTLLSQLREVWDK